jgi:hypothetical protein
MYRPLGDACILLVQLVIILTDEEHSCPEFFLDWVQIPAVCCWKADRPDKVGGDVCDQFTSSLITGSLCRAGGRSCFTLNLILRKFTCIPMASQKRLVLQIHATVPGADLFQPVEDDLYGKDLPRSIRRGLILALD